MAENVSGPFFKGSTVPAAKSFENGYTAAFRALYQLPGGYFQ
jgi:hypothetical protein